MKKFLFFLSIFTLKLSNAQLILIQANNAPVPGTIEPFRKYDSTTSFPRHTGLNQVWDFDAAVWVDGPFSYTYMTAGSTDAVSQLYFPGSNLAYKSGPSYFYFRSQSDTLNYLGDAYIYGGATLYTEPRMIITWPFTYGSISTDTFVSTTTNSASYYATFGTQKIEGTGTGTVILPTGIKYINCLQVTRDQTIEMNGAYTATYTERYHEYWHGSFRTPLATLITFTVVSPDDGTIHNSILSVNSLADVGIDENQLIKEGFFVYPNPAKDKLNIMFKDNAVADEMELYDASGKLILLEKNANTLDVSKLSKGIYVVKVRSKNSSVQKQVIITE